MKKALKVIVPILLVLVILASIAWYLFSYDRGFTMELLLHQARFWENQGKHSTAAWFYDLAYKQSGNDEAVAIELAQRFKEIGNYTKAEYTLSNAIRDGGTVELYIALCGTYVEQDKLLDAVTMLDNVADPAIKAELDAMRPAAPVADLDPGFYSQYMDVNITAESGTLYASTDGEYPSLADAPYTQAITLPGGETNIYAVAVGENGLVSPVSIFGYTVGGVIEEVTFADSAMEQAVRAQLNVGAKTVVYTDDLWSIEKFSVPEEAETCADLALLTHVTELTIPEGCYDSGEFLSALQNLRSLSITGAPVTGEDLKTISALPNLEQLALKNCSISNIEALAAAQKLTVLDLSGNAVREIDALASLGGLQELNLQHNAVTNLTALSGLSNLAKLDVSYNAITSIAPISPCVGLTWLDVSQNNLSSLGAVGNLSALKTFLAENNSLTDVSALAGCTALETLNISGNSVQDISALSALVSLRDFAFAHNQVVYLPEFPEDSALSTLDGSYNWLLSLDALGGLPHLNKVLMDYNTEIESVAAMASCPVLVQVSVFGTRVSDVSALTANSVIVNYDPTQTVADNATEPDADNATEPDAEG